MRRAATEEAINRDRCLFGSALSVVMVIEYTLRMGLLSTLCEGFSRLQGILDPMHETTKSFFAHFEAQKHVSDTVEELLGQFRIHQIQAWAYAGAAAGGLRKISDEDGEGYYVTTPECLTAGWGKTEAEARSSLWESLGAWAEDTLTYCGSMEPLPTYGGITL